MRKRSRVPVRSRNARHGPWYLWVSGMIGHLEVPETRKPWSRLVEVRRLIKVAIRFYQAFGVDRGTCALVADAGLCEVPEAEIIVADKGADLQSTRGVCRRWRRWWNKQAIESLLLQSLVRSLECKGSETRAFECNEDINVGLGSLWHQTEYETSSFVMLIEPSQQRLTHWYFCICESWCVHCIQ